jgi:hypothetical protein
LGKLLKLSDLERIEPKIRLLRKTQQVSILNWQKNSSPIISSIVIRYFTPFLFRYSITIGLELESFLRDTRISIKLKSFLTSFWNKIRILRHLRKISIVTDSKKVWDERISYLFREVLLNDIISQFINVNVFVILQSLYLI